MKSFVLTAGGEDRVVISDNNRFYAVTIYPSGYSINRQPHIDVSGFHQIDVDSAGPVTSSIDELYGDETPHTKMRGRGRPDVLAGEILSDTKRIFGPYLDTIRLHVRD